MENDPTADFLGGLARAWHYRGDYCVGGNPEAVGEIVQSRTQGPRSVAVVWGGYRKLSGSLACEGNVGLIQPEVGKPVIVRREVSQNGVEYLVEI